MIINSVWRSEGGAAVVQPCRLLSRLHRMLLALLVLLAPTPGATRPDLIDVQVSRNGAAVAVLRVEFAATEAQRQRGLMFREHLAPNGGMLFRFEPPRHAAMWMKNTLIPLDMLFIDAAGRIVHIEKQTTPHSLRAISAEGPVALVIEVAGGQSDRLGLRLGDRVEVDAAVSTSGSSTPH